MSDSKLNSSAGDRREQKRLALIDAALRIFASVGFSGAKIDDVAAEAGIGKGTVYLYYESKTALFKDVVRQKLLPLISEVDELRSGYTGSATELLKLQMRRFYQEILNDDRRKVIRLVLMEGSQFPEISSFYGDTVIRSGQNVISETLTRGILAGEMRSVPVDLAARSIVGGIMAAGIWRTFFSETSLQELEAQCELHLDVVLNGILT